MNRIYFCTADPVQHRSNRFERSTDKDEEMRNLSSMQPPIAPDVSMEQKLQEEAKPGEKLSKVPKSNGHLRVGRFKEVSKKLEQSNESDRLNVKQRPDSEHEINRSEPSSSNHLKDFYLSMMRKKRSTTFKNTYETKEIEITSSKYYLNQNSQDKGGKITQNRIYLDRAGNPYRYYGNRYEWELTGIDWTDTNIGDEPYYCDHRSMFSDHKGNIFGPCYYYPWAVKRYILYKRVYLNPTKDEDKKPEDETYYIRPIEETPSSDGDHDNRDKPIENTDDDQLAVETFDVVPVEKPPVEAEVFYGDSAEEEPEYNDPVEEVSKTPEQLGNVTCLRLGDRIFRVIITSYI